MKRRTTRDDFLELVPYLDPGEPIAATTGELNALLGRCWRLRTRPPTIRGHRLVEVAEW